MNSPVIDVNVNLSRWPTRRMPDDETARLVKKLLSQGVIEAWTGSFDGLFHKDIASVNSRLVEECRAQKELRLVPFGTVNPKLPEWEDDLRRCHEVHRMPGIRLHPNYHGYELSDPAFGRLLQMAAERNLIVQLAAIMEDERMMHPLLRVSPVDLSPLADLVPNVTGLKLVLINALGRLRGESLSRVVLSGEVSVEISMLESIGGLERLLKDVPLERVLFGSHAPAFYLESSILKLQESPLAAIQLQSIRQDNARTLLPLESVSHLFE